MRAVRPADRLGWTDRRSASEEDSAAIFSRSLLCGIWLLLRGGHRIRRIFDLGSRRGRGRGFRAAAAAQSDNETNPAEPRPRRAEMKIAHALLANEGRQILDRQRRSGQRDPTPPHGKRPRPRSDKTNFQMQPSSIDGTASADAFTQSPAFVVRASHRPARSSSGSGPVSARLGSLGGEIRTRRVPFPFLAPLWSTSAMLLNALRYRRDP